MNHHNHSYKAACLDVKAICDSALKKNGIHFFDYARLFDDGSCYLLSNNEKVIDYLFETESPLFASIPSNLVRDKFLYFIPEDGPYHKVMHDAKSYFNIAHGFDMFEIHPGHVDVCCFAGSAENNEMVNYFFNNVEFLKDFMRNFKDQASGLITKLNQNTFYLPEKMQLNFNSSKISFQKNRSLLTKRQKECLTYLVKGMTINEIAQRLNLSPRTVGHYIEATKVKLNCNTRTDLIIKSIKILSDEQS